MRPLLPARVITVKLIELQKSLLDTRKFFRPFLNTLTANDSIPLVAKSSELKNFRCIYLKKKTFFLNFFLHFQNLH